jgi:gamma-glutamylaminecyclotransferase
MSQRVFVYGTLKRGRGNHHFLQGQRYIGKGNTLPRYALYDLGGYPGMVETEDQPAAIAGEIWEVDDDCLAELDELESIADGEYARVWLRELEAFAYVYEWPVDSDSRVPGDSW